MQGSQSNPTELHGYDEYDKQSPEARPYKLRTKYRGESIRDMMARLTEAQRIAAEYQARK